MGKSFGRKLFALVAGVLMVILSAHAQTSSVQLRTINPPGVSIPGISAGVVVTEGRLLFLSGHVPITAEGTIPQGLEAQLRTVFENLSATLRAADSDFRSVARITIMVKDYNPSMLATIRRVRDEYVDAKQPPASALVGVASLFDDKVLVEVDAVAVVK